MNCTELKFLQAEFLDGLLSIEERQTCEQHLQTCQSCHSQLELLDRFRTSLQECRIPAPQALQTLVMGAAYRLSERQPFWKDWRQSLHCWRENLDSSFVFSKLAALPFTMLFFVVILAEFSSAPRTVWYPVYTANPAATVNRNGTDVLQLSYVPMMQFAESAAMIPDDSFVVLTRVDRYGMTTLEQIIDAPRNPLLLQLFANRMKTVRCRPLQKNGNRLDAYLIVPYQKISVIG
ncbi:MAG: hypothetical protein HY644_05735 [Acidobacteria bacterium]|nr:hypothetical protein [Acidobacteriota bacterium]